MIYSLLTAQRVRYGRVDVANIKSGQRKYKIDLLRFGSLTNRFGWESNSGG